MGTPLDSPVQQPPVPLVEGLLLSEDSLHVDDQQKWRLNVTEGITATKGQGSNDFGP